MEGHTPHHLPNHFSNSNRKINFKIGDAFAGLIETPDLNRIAYDNSTALLSERYKHIFRLLRNNFDYIITVSDHGEMLGEHEMWNHGYGIYPELAHVPVVISGEDLERSTNDSTVSLIDIPETISDIVDLDFNSRGRNLLDITANGEYLVEYHGFLPWNKDQLKQKGVEEIYYSRDSALRGIITNNKYVYNTHEKGYCSDYSEPTKNNIERLNALAKKVPERDIEIESDKTSVSVRRRLEYLGYA